MQTVTDSLNTSTASDFLGMLQKMFPNEFRNTKDVKTMTSCDVDPSCRKVLLSLNEAGFV